MELWACTQCRSLNTRSRATCYGCGLPRDPQALGATPNGGIRPLHIFMAAAAAVIVALTGVGAMTLVGHAPPAAPRATPPAIAALPSPSLPVAPIATPTATRVPTVSPPQSEPPTASSSPKATDIRPAKVIKSSNWSGYGLRTEQYVSVSAEWTQPAVDCSAGNDANASFWVGLDGVKSHSVEQTGTSADCRAGRTVPVYYAWYEMFPEPMRRAPVLVRAGDHFSALVQGLSAQKYELTLKNLTTGQSFSTSASRSGTWPSSAEWVVEPAAFCKSTCTTSVLAQFGDVTFTNIAAQTIDGPVTFASASSQLVLFDLRSKRGAHLADVSALAGDVPTFNIGWTGASPGAAPSPSASPSSSPSR